MDADATLIADVPLTQMHLIFIVGGLFAVLLILCIIYCCCCRKKKEMPPPEFDFTIEEITAGKHLRKSQPVRQPQIVTPQNKKPKSEKKTKSKKPKKKKKGDGDPPPDKKGLAAGVVVPGTYEDIGPGAFEFSFKGRFNEKTIHRKDFYRTIRPTSKGKKD
uniref:Uncharacterized protein n=1 Tax=Meloidogyne hapla TaxID=6305 RepID=A0A1I8BNI7_MELHA